jgi:hypothetical protein
MTNGAGEHSDSNMGGGLEPAPTPDTSIEWGPEQFAQLRAKMIDIENKVDWTYHELEKTRAELETTKAELKASRAELTAAKANTGKGEAKGADPPLFTGNQRELETWITACRLRFAGQPSKFDTEEKKVVHATSFMRGPPLAWFQPVINAYSTAEHDDELPPEFQSFETFVQSIRVLYGDPDLQRNSERMIRHLKQNNGTVAEYISRFATHSQYTKFDDDSLTGHFYEGLHGDIKDELAFREWTNLKDLQILAGRLDARARQRKLEKEWEEKAAKPKSNPWTSTPPRRDNGTFLPAKSPFSSPPPSVNPFAQPTPPTMGSPAPAADGSTPMELDALQLQITPEERARCKLENRCYGCKKLGHSALKCRSKHQWKVATVEIQPAQSENDSAQE